MNARRIRLTAIAAFCGFAIHAAVASAAESLPSADDDPALAARMDALFDANAVGRRVEGMFEQIQVTMREHASSPDDVLRAKAEVMLALIEVVRWDRTRDLWRDAVAREIDPATLSAAEAFFASPVGEAFRRCIARAKSYPSDHAACAVEADAADPAAARFTRGDFPLDSLSVGPTLSAIMCRLVYADPAFLARVHAACRRTGATPPGSCGAVRTDLPTATVDAAHCGNPGVSR